MALICTNKAFVDTAFEKAAPRPLRDLMLAVYPDAVEDRNGRWHAPCDGYICPITDRTFAAGEFLPMQDPDENLRLPASSSWVPQAVDLQGRLHTWNGSRAQNRAVWAELIAQTRAYDAQTSKHIGVVGAAVELRDLTLEIVKAFEGYYAPVWLSIFKDTSGNVIVYKGSKRFKSDAYGPLRGRNYEVGDKLSLKAKVKEHKVREGVAQTLIERPKLL